MWILYPYHYTTHLELTTHIVEIWTYTECSFLGEKSFLGQFSWRECTNLLKNLNWMRPKYSHFEKKNAHIVMTRIRYIYTYGELQQQQMHNTTSFAKIRIYFTTVPSSINYQVPFYLELLCNFFAKEFNPIITSAIRFII